VYLGILNPNQTYLFVDFKILIILYTLFFLRFSLHAEHTFFCVYFTKPCGVVKMCYL